MQCNSNSKYLIGVFAYKLAFAPSIMCIIAANIQTRFSLLLVLLQVASPTTIIAAFVTFEKPGAVPAPVARLGKKADLSDAKQIAGVHRMYTETGADHRVYTMSFVRFTDLEPRTKYFYSVSAGTAGADFSETRSFSSLYGESSAPTRFAIFGDMGVYSYNNMDRLEADAKAGDIDFIIHLGDHAYNIADDDGYRGDGYMDAFSRVISYTPWVPVLGNHEYYDGDLFQRYTDMVMGGVNQSESESEIVDTDGQPSLRRRAQAKVTDKNNP